MRYRKKLIFLSAVIILVIILQLLLPGNPGMVRGYSHFVFRPYQTFRNLLLGKIPVSIGDLLYILGCILLIATIARWIYYLLCFKARRHALLHSLLRSLTVIGVLYVLFFIGWGGNYYKPTLSSYWGLETGDLSNDSILYAYDEHLIQKLNMLAPHYHALGFKEADKRAQQYFRKYTDSRTKLHGLNAKASVFGYFMQYLGIQGYYNPFTGEAQVNSFQPSFMLPFVVSHELAHQSGIAAEDDANLLAYALGTKVDDTAFRYSAYFNIWLYTHGLVRSLDSSRAEAHRAQLNPLTLTHLDTLREIRRKYRSEVSAYSGFLYDGYLRLHNQKEGIRSYNNAAVTAWFYELRSAKDPVSVLAIP